MNTFTKSILIGAAAGLAATWIKSKAEKPLQEIGEKAFPPKPHQLNLAGADIRRQPENMPCAIFASNIYEEVAGVPLSRQAKVKSLNLVRYTVGAGIGVVYIALANPIKAFRVNQGATAGIMVWTLSHASVLPKMKLQRRPDEMPDSWWVWEFGSHIIFGVALEQSRKLLSKLFKIGR
ncbi:MAG TPA: DUF1440 domain-containing protein [Flavobacteriaceae bacterium]|nr:DUF1440 domain-containing protein [Flavobacteriaceae bacterium]